MRMQAGQGVKSRGDKGKTAEGEWEAETAELSKGHDEDVFYARPKDARSVGVEPPRASRGKTAQQDKIPRETADTQPSVEQVEDGTINSDVFYDAGGKESHAKIPRVTEDTRAGTERVEEGGINSDVFYDSRGKEMRNSAEQEMEVAQERRQEQALEGVNTDVFHSPRVAKMLAGTAARDSSVKIDSAELAQNKAQDMDMERTGHRKTAQPATVTEAGSQPGSDAEIHELATDLSRNVKMTPSTTDVVR